MPDILDDYREWADEHLEQHVSTHSDRCHLWHDRCMIHRLAAALESAREAVRELEAAIETSEFEFRNTDSGPNLVLRKMRP